VRRILGLLSTIAICCAAAESSEKEFPIHQIFGVLNREPVLSADAISALFTAEADHADVARLASVLQQLSSQRRPWQELSSPRLSSGAIEFQSAETAAVQVSFLRYGPDIPWSATHFVLRVKKIGSGWKIASFQPAEPLIP
jgi:hypothetical protein